MRSWLGGASATCSSASYVRDNIHVSLLAKCYANYVNHVPTSGFSKINPSGYAESQGAFTVRLAQEMRARLGLPCVVLLPRQVEFPEPRVRINTDPLDADALGWNEVAAWDEMAAYYSGIGTDVQSSGS
jgi:hypothetical protein